MKTPLLFVAALALLSLSSCAAPGPDSVKQANQVNAVLKTEVSAASSRFLVEMVDARLMDYEEGRLAAERGTQAAIREYGTWMMRDQTELLKQLNDLAAASAVVVPSSIGADKRDGLKNLLEVSGETFDKRFIRSIRIDHERDVGEFQRATQSDDAAVSAFAIRNLPVIEMHLDGIRQIDKAYSR